MTKQTSTTASPEAVTAGCPLIYPSTSEHGFEFSHEIRSAYIGGKRWVAAPDVFKAAQVRTRTESGKPRSTTQYLASVPSTEKRVIQRQQCPALFNADGATCMTVITRRGVEKFLEGRLGQPGARQMHQWLTEIPRSGSPKASTAGAATTNN